MPTTLPYKHVFLQVDIKGLIDATGSEPPSHTLVREYTTIFDQGSLALGDPEKTFAIEVQTGDIVYFTVIPVQLYSYSTLYIRNFEVIKQNDKIDIKKLTDPSGHDLTFGVEIIKAEEGGEASFKLIAIIEYKLAGAYEQIEITIDPVLRANQGHHG